MVVSVLYNGHNGVDTDYDEYGSVDAASDGVVATTASGTATFGAAITYNDDIVVVVCVVALSCCLVHTVIIVLLYNE